MPVLNKIFPVFACAAILGACAQQEEAPTPIAPEPIYDKYGAVVGCSDGTEATPGTAAPANPCEPPDDGDCVEDSSTSTLECPPPRGGDRPDRTPDPSTRPDPTGSTPGAGSTLP